MTPHGSCPGISPGPGRRIIGFWIIGWTVTIMDDHRMSRPLSRSANHKPGLKMIVQSDQRIIWGIRVSLDCCHQHIIHSLRQLSEIITKAKSFPYKETPQRDRRPSMLKSGKKVINLTKIEAERGATSSIRHFKQNTSAWCRKK